MTAVEDPAKPDAGLYLVGTPIGNLGDITVRALEVLRSADLILAEDTRITRRLLDRYDIHAPMWSYHKFNEAGRIDPVLDRLRGGAVVALVTDSGMPGVSDPGARMVRACREAEIPITAAPGPSAVATAIALAGLEETAFVFGGFPPVKPGKRKKALARLLAAGCPVVVYESPYRVTKLLKDVQTLCPDADVFVARELTKKFEETGWKTVEGWLDAFATKEPRGEFALIIQSHQEALSTTAFEREEDKSENPSAPCG